MDDKYKFTAIIKSYNSEDIICNCLESVKDFSEIIIIDQHSKDDINLIAKEYKAKIIYSSKVEFLSDANKILENIENDWVLVLEDNEIVPQKLILEFLRYTEKPKKNRYAVSLPEKTFYQNKEIKSARNKAVIKFFKKGYCEFLNNYSTDLKLKQGKIYHYNKNFKIKNGYILKTIKNDILRNFEDIIEKVYFINKENENKKPSIIFKPLFNFFKLYFLKKGFLDGIGGFIFAKLKYSEDFIIETSLKERQYKNDNSEIN